MLAAGMLGAYSFRMSALVLAGLATTSTCARARGGGNARARGVCAVPPPAEAVCRKASVLLVLTHRQHVVHCTAAHTGDRWVHACSCGSSARAPACVPACLPNVCCTHLDVLAGVLLQRAGLVLVDGHVLGHHVLALHARLARETTHHHRHVHALARLVGVCGDQDVCEEGKRGKREARSIG